MGMLETFIRFLATVNKVQPNMVLYHDKASNTFITVGQLHELLNKDIDIGDEFLDALLSLPQFDGVDTNTLKEAIQQSRRNRRKDRR